MISPNGIAHIQLTVRDVAASRPFYHHLLVDTFGMATQCNITKPPAPTPRFRQSAKSP